jgi:TctA family transporter
MVFSNGDLRVFVERPISAVFVGLCCLLLLTQVYFWQRRTRAARAAQPAPVASDPAG